MAVEVFWSDIVLVFEVFQWVGFRFDFEMRILLAMCTEKVLGSSEYW